MSSTVDTIEQSLYMLNKAYKPELLMHLLKDPAWTKVLVFTRTKHGANKVVAWLEKHGVRAMPIHGNKSQNARVAAMEAFRDGTIRVLVATDIAARGLDIDNVTHVVNYHPPNEPETYVHRIGRTGRAGRSGVSVTFSDMVGEEPQYVRDIERLIRKPVPLIAEHPFAGMAAPELTDEQRAQQERSRQGGRNGRGGRGGRGSGGSGGSGGGGGGGGRGRGGRGRGQQSGEFGGGGGGGGETHRAGGRGGRDGRQGGRGGGGRGRGNGSGGFGQGGGQQY